MVAETGILDHQAVIWGASKGNFVQSQAGRKTKSVGRVNGRKLDPQCSEFFLTGTTGSTPALSFLIEPAGFGAVSAVLHITPAAPFVAAGIQKKPPTSRVGA